MLRGWTLVAETWAFVAIPAHALVPDAAGLVAGAHLLVGYVTLGVLLAARPRPHRSALTRSPGGPCARARPWGTANAVKASAAGGAGRRQAMPNVTGGRSGTGT